MDDARHVPYGDLVEGLAAERDYVLTPAVHEAFLTVFGDRSPLHVDEAHARAAGFPGVVMHGGILNGFVSHFVGMVLPGAPALLLASELRFLRPSHLGDTLRLQATVAQRLESQRVVVLHLRFENLTRGGTAATGRVQVKVREA